jgi:hypothetical protein
MRIRPLYDRIVVTWIEELETPRNGQTVHRNHSRQAILRGVNQPADAVKVTRAPAGSMWFSKRNTADPQVEDPQEKQDHTEG